MQSTSLEDIGESDREVKRRRGRGRFRLREVIPASFLLVTAIAAIFAPLLAPHSPREGDLSKRSIPPVPFEGSLAEHIFGTDRQGRDIFSRILFGGQISLALVAAVILLAGVVGSSLGLIAGYRGGVADTVIMRSADIMMAFPTILLALLLAVVRGPSFGSVLLVLVLIVWARFARIVRGECIAIKTSDYVALARTAGCSPMRIVRRHFLPNVLSSIMVVATLQMGWVILIESSLSFLGAGIPPPTPSWGGMLSEGRSYLPDLWWISVIPGLTIAAVVLALNLLGDALRDRFDPRMEVL